MSGPPPKPPLMRSRTLPAMLVPGLSILHAQIEAAAIPATTTTTTTGHQQETKSNVAMETNVLEIPGQVRRALFTFECSPKQSTKRSTKRILRFRKQEKRSRSPQGQGRSQRQTERQGQGHGCLKRTLSLESLCDKSAEWAVPPDVIVASPPPCLTLIVPDLHPANCATNNKKLVNKISERKKDLVTKSDCKKMEKLSKINIHQQALFAAVETGQEEKARAILETTDVDISSCNNDGLSILDVAVLLGNVNMAKLLISFAAKEGTQYGCKEDVVGRLNQLLNEAECKLDASKGMRNDQDKSAALWKRKLRLLRKMRAGIELLKLPSSPNQVRVEVSGEDSVVVWWTYSHLNTSDVVTTKIKVEWSCVPDFSTVGGYLECRDLIGCPEVKVHVRGLPTNQRCYFRVSAGNIAGYSCHKPTLPPCVLLSVWRSVDDRKARFADRLPLLEDLLHQLSEIRDIDDSGASETPAKMRKNQTKMSLRQLFGNSVKLHKNLRRGIYLACVLFHQDKILVTNEEFPPVAEIDDNYPAAFHNDFHWLMKVASTWADVKHLRQDMEKNISTSNAHFRIKLLQAAATLQSALGIQDLGQLYYQPLKDSQGTVVLTTVCRLPSTKSISPSVNFKWVPVAKLHKISPSEDLSAGELLVKGLEEQVNYGKLSSEPLERGLYICYLKMKSSVDLLRVLVPKDRPNVLPFCKVRNNPWVSSEEWQWIKSLRSSSSADNAIHSLENSDDQDAYPSTAQLLFQNQVLQSARKLVQMLNIDSETAKQHRFYTNEVIELNEDVSLVLLLPPAEGVCSVAGQDEAVFQREDFVTIPVQVFETIHLRTYQKDLIGRYSRLSCVLELETNLAQHAMREAFSSVELTEAKHRVSLLQDLQTRVDSAWRGCRWIMDVLSLARDRTINIGVTIATISNQIHSSISLSGEDFHESPRLSREGILLRMKSDGKLQTSAAETPGRGTFKYKTCAKCSVPIDLPGYISSCDSCSHSRIRCSNSSQADLVKQQSKSDDSLPVPPSGRVLGLPTNQDSRKIVSRSENQLHSIAFHPFLDSEDADMSLLTPTLPLTTEPHKKIHRGGIGYSGLGYSGIGSSMRSNSQDSECSKQSKSSLTPSLTSLSSGEGDQDNFSTRSAEAAEPDPNAAGIIQVFAAYESGLANGTSVKLHVTGKTTAREVVDLVVRQLNMAVVLKGKEGPIYGSDELKHFCLVTVIGARERCLRDDFRPLQLQNPWKKGRLFVRQKKDLLAAIEQNMRQITSV